MADAMGTLLVCLHPQESDTVPEVDIGGDCCHGVTEPEAPACGDCTDLKLQSVDAQVVRQSVPGLPALLCGFGSGENAGGAKAVTDCRIADGMPKGGGSAPCVLP